MTGIYSNCLPNWSLMCITWQIREVLTRFQKVLPSQQKNKMSYTLLLLLQRDEKDQVHSIPYHNANTCEIKYSLRIYSKNFNIFAKSSQVCIQMYNWTEWKTTIDNIYLIHTRKKFSLGSSPLESWGQWNKDRNHSDF